LFKKDRFLEAGIVLGAIFLMLIQIIVAVLFMNSV